MCYYKKRDGDTVLPIELPGYTVLRYRPFIFFAFMISIWKGKTVSWVKRSIILMNSEKETKKMNKVYLILTIFKKNPSIASYSFLKIHKNKDSFWGY